MRRPSSSLAFVLNSRSTSKSSNTGKQTRASLHTIHDGFHRKDSRLSSVLTISDAAQQFEPQTDWTALGTFVSIMLVFLLLVRRTAAVEQAVMERDAALNVVRRLKSKELEGSDAGVALAVQQALGRYEAAVLEEERLRNIVPGVVRIVPPSSGNAAEEVARDAAKQFLGKDYDIGVPKREENPSGKLPMIALGILAFLGVSLTGLLFLLSIDPMTASSILKDL